MNLLRYWGSDGWGCPSFSLPGFCGVASEVWSTQTFVPSDVSLKHLGKVGLSKYPGELELVPLFAVDVMIQCGRR